MISKITIKGVASYKQQSSLETDKNVNLIYGLNGSGKSTLSEFLRQGDSPSYADCSISPEIAEEEEILVYNEHYVNEVFYQNDTQKGIFSLSKENSAARRKIDEATKKYNDARKERDGLLSLRNKVQTAWLSVKNSYADRFWEIKKRYSGGDRVLEYCLDGLKGSKDSLLNYIVQLKKVEKEPDYSIENLKAEIQELNNAKGTQIPYVQTLSFPADDIENNQLFTDIITGNPDSRVAKLIDSLHISDWVKSGLRFDTGGVCPFCQRQYSDDNILEELKAYFNEDYEKSLVQIALLRDKYQGLIDALPVYDFYDKVSNLEKYKNPFLLAFSKFSDLIKANCLLFAKKTGSPSESIQLQNTEDAVNAINGIIQQVNNEIKDFNDKVSAIDREYQKIKARFWARIRFDYDQTVQDYLLQKKATDRKVEEIKRKEDSAEELMNAQYSIIEKEQDNVINIDSSIANINAMLIDMGITDFRIIKSEGEGQYRIVRNEDDAPVFKSLSEGERTIISVLYFIETCKGLLDKTQVMKKRIVVIDDPVSSLSNVFIFNIGRLIRDVFYPSYKKKEGGEEGFDIKPKFEQIFILTHSLYFLYEMTEMSEAKRHASQALYRIYKTDEGSRFEKMRYEHIQTEYHTYWYTIRDPKTNPALIANCMRNIVEYFFNFVEKRDLNNVFNQDKFKQLKYQAFVRYINRESHSLGQNIYDFKDFDYDVFMDALKLVFSISGYEEHYKVMMNI